MSLKDKFSYFNMNIEDIICPICKRKGNIVRLHSRNSFERLLKKLYLKRYYCDYCTWTSRLFRRKD